MIDGAKQVGKVSDSDRRLMDRVKELVVQARITEGLLQAHFAAEYDLTPSRSILADGTIWEEASEDTKERD
jgi:hypothetical protein